MRFPPPTKNGIVKFVFGGSVRPFRFMLLHRWPWLIVMVVLTLFAAIAGLAAPFFQKVFVDHLTGVVPQTMYGDNLFSTVESELFQYHPITLLTVAFLAMVFSQWLGTLSGWLGMREAIKRQDILGDVIYRKTLSLRQDQTAGHTVGEVVSIYATDVPGSTAIVDQTIPMGAGVIFPFVCAPLAVQLICGIPVGVTVMVMLAVLTVSIALSVRQSTFFQKFKRLAADRTGLVNEWIQNVRLLRILGWIESYERKIFLKREEETRNRVKMVTNGQMMGAFGSSINFFMNLVAVFTLMRVKGATATAGDFFALLWIFGVFLSRPFRQVPWIFTFTFDGWTSLKRIDAFLKRHPSSLNELSAKSRKPISQEPLALKVRDLNLTIDETPLLKSISFDLKAGEFAAIVGEVGSGKSLFLMSLLGETAATAGELRIGDTDYTHHPREERRAVFGFVPQDGFVMSSSLRENIIFRYDIGTEYDMGIHAALRAAQFDPTHEGVIDGLATEIGERGVNLSGGQRQRVGLARSVYLHRPVVLLDDALSAVDVETERKLFDTLLFGAWKKTTRLMVTHRLSVLDRVDRILFLKDGRLLDQGTFAELNVRSPEFQAFVSSMGEEPSPNSNPEAVLPATGEPLTAAELNADEGAAKAGVKTPGVESEPDT